jgi:hypothetical protein
MYRASSSFVRGDGSGDRGVVKGEVRSPALAIIPASSGIIEGKASELSVQGLREMI